MLYEALGIMASSALVGYPWYRVARRRRRAELAMRRVREATPRAVLGPYEVAMRSEKSVGEVINRGEDAWFELGARLARRPVDAFPRGETRGEAATAIKLERTGGCEYCGFSGRCSICGADHGDVA